MSSTPHYLYLLNSFPGAAAWRGLYASRDQKVSGHDGIGLGQSCPNSTTRVNALYMIVYVNIL